MGPGQKDLLGALFEGYQRLKPTWQDRIKRALIRFAQAKGRIDWGDKALDLGIALEMILLGTEHSGQERPDNLRAHFRFRGSWLLGVTGKERLDLFKVLGEIYDWRSQVAHSGILDTPDKLEPEQRDDKFGKHEEIAERIFQKLILNGPPDWTNLVLGITK